MPELSGWEKFAVEQRERDKAKSPSACPECEVLTKNLQAISAVCGMAGIGEQEQTALDRVKELHAEFGRQIERADKAEADRDRHLAVVRAADRLAHCMAEFDDDPAIWGEHINALHDTLVKCEGTRTAAMAEEWKRALDKKETP